MKQSFCMFSFADIRLAALSIKSEVMDPFDLIKMEKNAYNIYIIFTLLKI